MKIEIILAATNNKACLVIALSILFTYNLQPRNTPIFYLISKFTVFAKNIILDIL